MKIVFALVIAFATFTNTSFAEGVSFNSKALALLLKTNPIIKADFDEYNNKSLVEIYSQVVLSNVPYADEGTDGTLATTSNACEAENSNTYACFLRIDIQRAASYNEEGNIVFGEDKTESQVIFVYKIDKDAKKVIGKVEVIIAG